MLASRNSAESVGDPCVSTITAQFWTAEHPLSVSSDSVGHEVLAHRVWHLHVSLLVPVTITYSCCFPNRSWEFVTTLNFEWNVIRRHQRYRWTIWVRDDKALI
jgi:hypothetical protein